MPETPLVITLNPDELKDAERRKSREVVNLIK